MSFLKNKINSKSWLIRKKIEKEYKLMIISLLAVSFVMGFVLPSIIFISENDLSSASFLSIASLFTINFIGVGIAHTLKKLRLACLSKYEDWDFSNTDKAILNNTMPDSLKKEELSEEDFAILKKLPYETSLNESEINAIKAVLFTGGINNQYDYIRYLIELSKYEKSKEKINNGDYKKNSVKHFIDRVENQIEHINR